jgi:putative membrane protein
MPAWQQWSAPLGLNLLLVLAGARYALMAGPWRSRVAPGRPFPAKPAACFYAALLCCWLAVSSPLDYVGSHCLLSVHVLQQAILMYVVPVLFLLGLPYWMIDPLLQRPVVRATGRFVTQPVVSAVIVVLTVTLWHLPAPFGWALRSSPAHQLQHAMLLGAAVCFWWPHLSPSRVLPRRSYATQMLFQFGALAGQVPVFVYITFSSSIIYPAYAQAPRLVAGFTPAEDQLLAGVGMHLIAVGVALVAIIFSFYHWYQENERRTGLV